MRTEPTRLLASGSGSVKLLPSSTDTAWGLSAWTQPEASKQSGLSAGTTSASSSKQALDGDAAAADWCWLWGPITTSEDTATRCEGNTDEL